MHKQYFIGIALAICLMVSCKPSPDKAEKYYLSIVPELQAVLEKEGVLIDAVNQGMKSNDSSVEKAAPDSSKSHRNIKNVEMAFNNLNYQIQVSQNRLDAIDEFGGKGPDILGPAKFLLAVYRELIQTDYPELIRIIKIPSYEYTNEDDNRFMLTTARIDSVIQKGIEDFSAACYSFAAFYRFKIENDTI